MRDCTSEGALFDGALELERLRARCADLETLIEDMRREAITTTRELSLALEEQHAALERAAEAAAAVAAIRASNSGRLAGAYAHLRTRTSALGGRWRHLANRRSPARRRRAGPASSRLANPAVNVAGYITAESGMGEATRCTIRALQHAGIPVVLNNVPAPQRMCDSTFADFTAENPHPFNVVHLNADNMAWFADERGRAYFDGRYTIGYWFWELEEFRSDWLDAFDYVDEVWVASEFSRRSIGKRAPVPVVHVPLGLADPIVGDFSRDHFGLSENAFVFLHVFDVSSQMERKNPLGAVRAFRMANLHHDEAVLVLKFTNAQADPVAVRRLSEAASGAHVRLIGGVIDRPELNALMRSADGCLSLHRAEGLGLTVAEHMAMGKPAVATDYSGTTDFMTAEVSCLVSARPAAIARSHGPYLQGYRWAEPDLEEAAAHLRTLVRAPDYARALGAKGAAHVRRALSLGRSSALMTHRLQQIGQGSRRITGIAPTLDSPAQLYQ